MSMFALIHPATGQRVLFNTETNYGERIATLAGFIDAAGIIPRGETHQIAVIAGPAHPMHADALIDYGLEPIELCRPEIVADAVMMLTDAEILPPEAADDTALNGTIALSFATPNDWENRAASATRAMQAHLADFEGFEDPDNLAPASVIALASCAAALTVAITKAHQDWSV